MEMSFLYQEPETGGKLKEMVNMNCIKFKNRVNSNGLLMIEILINL